MPSRNIIKQYGEDTYYHVYNRGVNKAPIFREPSDYSYFLYLFKRHLSSKPALDKFGRQLPHYKDSIDLIAFCLMSNHYHLMVLLKQTDGLEKLMRSTMTAYSMYYNKKYRRVGSLFQNHFLAAAIETDSYYWHISRYIHLNPLDTDKDPFEYAYSSLPYYVGNKHAEWLHPEHLINTSSPNEKNEYKNFLRDYEAMHNELSEIKHSLADPSLR